MSSGNTFSALVGVNADQCIPVRKRVAANDSANSYLVDKVNGTNLCAGTQMPQGADPLSATEIQAIKDWINAGASNN
ncbi:MAG: hypothetical protein Q7T11_09775 [Deltaproteobacteria bacterium]|nr:hypothetical protein [Deltaproteobacteria bacterium]